jgi:hypothetical protein
MVAWKLFDGDDARWDDALLALPDHNVYQSSGWARHKLSQGWRLRRAIAGDRAMVQALYKKFPGGSVLWSRGGPVGEPSLWNDDMRRALTKGLGLCYFRMCSYREQNAEQAAALFSAGWKRPKHPFNRALTFHFDLTKDEKTLFDGLTENWRHNLRRGQKRCAPPVHWQDPKAEELIKVYRRMEDWKGIKEHFVEGELTSLLSHLKDGIILMRADAQDGTPVALRACVRQGDRAWDLLAAASNEGRKNYASYAIFWALITQCQKLGVKSYDMGGADPDKARGVFDFKKGTRAKLVEFLGEWDWSTFDLARRGFGWALKAKGVGDS